MMKMLQHIVALFGGMTMDLSEKILKLRKSREMSRDELAKRLGVSRQSILKWEGNQATPKALCEEVVK